MPEKTRIILDTNFLMIPVEFKVDIFAEIKRLMIEPYDLCLFEATMGELDKLSKGTSKTAIAAKATLSLIKQKNLKSLPNSNEEKYVDGLILDGSTAKDIVCTQDQALKRLLKARHKGIRLIALKSKKHLGFE